MHSFTVLLILTMGQTSRGFADDPNERCQLVLATTEAVVGKAAEMGFCDGIDYTAGGRVVVDATTPTEPFRASGIRLVQSVVPERKVCQNRFAEVYRQKSWNNRRKPKYILYLSVEPAQRPWMYSFSASVQGFPGVPSEGSIALCGGVSGLIRKKGDGWMVTVNKDGVEEGHPRL